MHFYLHLFKDTTFPSDSHSKLSKNDKNFSEKKCAFIESLFRKKSKLDLYFFFISFIIRAAVTIMFLQKM